MGSKVGEQHLVKLLWHGTDLALFLLTLCRQSTLSKQITVADKIIVVKGKADRSDVINRLSVWLKSNYYWS